MPPEPSAAGPNLLIMTPQLPKDEAARLEALRQYRILDTPREDDFDEIVRLAARLCDMPISLISLVDEDRQWFKGRYGLDMAQTPRSISFCGHTILNRSEEHTSELQSRLH